MQKRIANLELENEILKIYVMSKKIYGAPIESFHTILKKEEVTKDNVYKNFEEAKLHLENYIENWYNNERIHSSIGYRTPNEVYYEKIA